MHDNPGDVVKAQKRSIEMMIRHGARHIIWVNMPDMGRTPRFLKADFKTRSQVKYLISLHNQWHLNTLNQMKAEHGKKGVNIHLMDARALFWKVLNNAIAFNITNVTEPCAAVSLPGADGGSVPKQPEGAIASLVRNSARTGMAPLIGTEVYSNPQLAHIFQASEKEPTVCSNPDQYAFWDDVHPTTRFHKIFAELICDELKALGYQCDKSRQPVTPALTPKPVSSPRAGG